MTNRGGRNISLPLQIMRISAVALLFIALALAGLAAAPALWGRIAPGGAQPPGTPAPLPGTPTAPEDPPPSATLPLIPTPLPSSTPLSAQVTYEPGSLPGLGEQAVILSVGEGGHSHLFAFFESIAPLARLTDGPWHDLHPAVSPDGLSLAFTSNRAGPYDLFLMDLASGTITQITDTPEYEGSPTFSPDGLYLAYSAYVEDALAGGNLEIFVRPLDGSSEPIRLTDDPGADDEPAWSPQGRLIAFTSTRSGDSEIWLADLDKFEQRFSNTSLNRKAFDAHPAWSPDGSQLSWSSRPENGIQNIVVRQVENPQNPPEIINSGEYAAWNPQADTLAAVLVTPQQTYLTGYSLAQHNLSMPVLMLEGQVQGMTWLKDGFPGTLAQGLPAWALPSAALTPTPLTVPVINPQSDVPGGRSEIVALDGITAPVASLQDRADEPFYALRERVIQAAGWDFLSNLEAAYTPLSAPPNPAQMEDWSYTGRGIRFNQAPFNAGWVLALREDFGAQTYWRIFLRTRFQDGSQGRPLNALPWDFAARFSGDPLAYEHGGKPAAAIPPGYWVDFTELAAAYGWERQPAQPSWLLSYSAARFNEFVFREGLDWLQAMLEIYPKAALDTPTPIPPPSETPTPTATFTATPTFTNTPYYTRTPTITNTRRPTRTPTFTNTPRPTRTPTATSTPKPTSTSTPTPEP